MIRLYHFSSRFFKLRHLVKEKKRQETLWTLSTKKFLLANLPLELQIQILQYLDIKSLLALSQASRPLFCTCLEQQVWIGKMIHDWPEATKTYSQMKIKYHKNSLTFSANYNKDRGLSRYSPAYYLYKQRWLAAQRPKPRAFRSKSEEIIFQEAENAAILCWQLIVIPFSILGYMVLPIQAFIRYRLGLQTVGQGSNLVLVIKDLSHLTERAKAGKKMHLVGVLCVLNTVLLSQNEVARLLSLINLYCMQFASGHLFFSDSDAGRFYRSGWKILSLPLITAIHAQILLIPWFLANIYQLTSIYKILLYVFWLPIVSSFEEISYDLALVHLDSSLQWLLIFFKVFTLTLQTLLGLLFYTCFLLMSVLANST